MKSNNSILNLRQKLDNKEVSSLDLFSEASNKAHMYQDDYNLFVTIIDEKIEQESNSILAGIPYALKDNISTKGILTTASSNLLKDYVPVYDATVYEKLKNAGAVLVGKTTLDELAMGGTGTTAHTGLVRNPWDKTRQIGGSSSGSAGVVCLDIVPYAIGSDTGDSIRKPAAYAGVVGFKPTYGLISRYGLFAFASSLDHVGVLARSVRDVSLVTDVIKGHDPKDMTSLASDNIIFSDNLDKDISGKKLFYIKEICDYNTSNDEESKAVLDNFFDVVKKVEALGASVCEVSIDKDLLNAIYPTYMSISCAEATSNNANLVGIHFGNRLGKDSIEDIMFETRTQGFSELIKRRFVLGSYILQKENQEKLYLNACRIRRLLVEKLTSLFMEYDGLIMPASGGIAPKFYQKSDKLSDKYLLLENHLALANFGGFPSITIPSGFVNKMPVGVNITSGVKKDLELLNIANKIEEKLGYKDMIVGEDNV